MTLRWMAWCSIAIGGAVALPATAGAATPTGSGTSVLRLQGAAADALRDRGVMVGAVAPVTGSGKRFTLPVTSATVGSAAQLGYGGGLRLRAGSRSLTLSTLRLALARDARLSVRLGGQTVTLLTVTSTKRKLDGTRGTALLAAATVRLTAAGASAVRRALHLRTLKAGVLGTLTVDARTTAGSSTTPASPITPGTTVPPSSGSPTAPTVPVVTPPVESGPTPLARPATAVDISAAAITWHVRDSFIQYINTGEGTSVSGGATADPPSVQPGSSAPLVYAFHFPFKDGWYDPVSHTARVTYTGTVTFGYRAHGIKLTAADPEIELATTGSRGIFRTGNTGEAAKRGVLENLDPTHAVATTHSPDGTAHTYSEVPGSIPADAGASVFAGYYAAGAPFGWVSVDLTTPAT